MVRKLIGMLLSLLLILPSAVFALGMGEIKLKSALNQPFAAEIELLSATADEASSLKVNLASYETFTRLGLDRPAVLMFLRFSVEQSGKRYYIKISSTEPIREPFLSMLVEVSWSAGRLLREYTVLIDPPGMGQEEPPVVQAPVTAASKAMTSATAISTQAKAAAAAITATPASQSLPEGGLSYGPVKADETMWSIASRMRPNKSISTQQMMMALLKSNPDAFYDNNVNRLKAGYVLRIDDLDMITAISYSEAVRAISAQNRAWQDQIKRAAAQAAETPVTTSTEQAARVVAAPVEPRLKLVASEGEQKSVAGTATDSAIDETVRKGLLLAEERNEAQQRENEQLKARMKEMEEQLASIQRLLELKDADLAALQQQLGQAAEADTLATDVLDADSAAAEVAVGSAEEAVKAEEANKDEEVVIGEGTKPTAEEKPVIEEEKPATEAKPAKHVKPKPAPAPVAEPGFIDELLADPIMLSGFGVLLVILLGLLGLIIKRRRSGGAGFSESILTAGGSSVLNSQVSSREMSEESSLFSDLAVSGMSNLQGGDAEADPLTEADVYMAYGRYQQAEELLKSALGTQPERHDIKLKLMEVYYSSKDRSAFEALADELFTDTDGTGPLWAKALVMGHELCPDNSMFNAAHDVGGEVELGGMEIDDVLDIGLDMAALAEDMEADAVESGVELDFDLGVDFSDLDMGSTSASEESENITEAHSELEEVTDVMPELADLAYGLEDDIQTTDSADADPLLDIDFGGLDMPAAQSEPEESTDVMPELADLAGVLEEDVQTTVSAEADPLLDIDLGDLDFGASETDTAADTAELDDVLGGLDLDFSDSVADASTEATELDDDLVGLDLGLDDGFMGSPTEAEQDELGDLDLGDINAVDTKLDLARAYVDMGELDSARSILNEVMTEGDEQQKSQAQELLDTLS
ncbi:MAG: FimV/HubP family polar landmark protein [Thiohalomonadaceae bacterium]